MGIFATSKAVERLTERLESIDDVVSQLVRDRKALDLEFTELYDKVSHQMSRMAKRHAAAAKANGGDPEPDDIPDQYANLDPISRSIMIRRAGGGLQK